MRIRRFPLKFWFMRVRNALRRSQRSSKAWRTCVYHSMRRGNKGSGMVNATCRVGTWQDGEVSKQITKKVQNQGQKHDVFDLAHGPSDVRCSVYGVVVEIDTCTCSRRLVHVSSWLGRLWVPMHTQTVTLARSTGLTQMHSSTPP